MASFPLTSIILNLALLLFSISATSRHFQVGGDRGWVKPTRNGTQTFNEWAISNRFHIGDALYFKYERDSVLVVNSHDYQECIKSNPISRFDDGNTLFQFDRSGFFYFISGEQGHCESGQKLIIRVIHPSEVEPPKSAPPPKDGEGDGQDSDHSSPSGARPSSATELSVASYFIAALGGTLAFI
ncbi:hypothetical protein LguiB_026915 [Lonicera macranthoides]